MSPSRFRVDYRVFTVFVIVGFVMVAIAGAFVLGIGQGRLRDAQGEYLAQVADHTAAAVDAYMFRRIIDASIFAKALSIRDAALAGSGRPYDAPAVRDLDREWQQQPGVPAALADIFSLPASTYLAEVCGDDQVYREILVTDRYGRLVAASRKTTDYDQSDEDWWREAAGGGVQGRMAVSDVRWDESAGVFALEIAVPIAGPAGGGLAGILKVIADIREIGAVVGGIGIGRTGEANLLREDGSFVFSLRRLDPGARFFATDLLREHLQALKQGQPETPMRFSARTADGTPRLVGIALSQLKSSYPHLTWVVAVSQNESELFAPVRAQMTSLIIVLALTALAVVLFAFWFSTRLAAPPFETDLHLVEHPKLGRVAAQADEGEA